MRLHPGNAFLQTLRGDDGIGVENEGVFAAGLHDGLIVGARKTHVLLVLNISDLGMPFTRKCDAIVTRQVVHDNDLARYTLHSLLHRAQSLL